MPDNIDPNDAPTPNPKRPPTFGGWHYRDVNGIEWDVDTDPPGISSTDPDADVVATATGGAYIGTKIRLADMTQVSANQVTDAIRNFSIANRPRASIFVVLAAAALLWFVDKRGRR